jgi:pantetheine-phosphate adenylyltransferase
LTTAVYPGSFDPITNGHLDVLERAGRLFDRVVIAVLENPTKAPLFSVEQRRAFIEESVRGWRQVVVDSFDGLLVNYARKAQAQVVVRGLRALSDFDSEFQMALMNRRLAPDLEVVFLMTSSEYSYLSSSLLKELYRFGGEVDDMVPPAVARALRERFPRANSRHPV